MDTTEQDWHAGIMISADGPPAGETWDALHAALGQGYSTAKFTPPDRLEIGFRVTAEGVTAAYIAAIGPLHRAAAALPDLVSLERLQRLTLSVFPSEEALATMTLLPAPLFDKLVADLDAPASPNPRLQAAFTSAREAAARAEEAEGAGL